MFVRGEGCELFDIDGNRYLDATACLWYCAIGHGRAEMAAAIGEQARTLAACSCFDLLASDVTLQLADRVGELAPVADPVVFLTSGGSDGIDTALKIARQYWSLQGRPEKRAVISRENGYHGMHAYGTSIGGIAANLDGFGELVGDTTRVPAHDATALADRIDDLGAERVAAFVAEPMLGAGGVYPTSTEYWQEVARICRDRDVLFIADEVITGFGRTGHWFASEWLGAAPDIMVVAKAITSGYVPLGAVIVSDRVARPFWEEGSQTWLRHGYTHSGHPTACAAALCNLDIIERERLVERVRDWSPKFAATVGQLEAVDGVAEVRTFGAVAGVQLDERLQDIDPFIGRTVVDECRRRGVLSRPLAGNTLLICPPFVMTDEQLGEIVDVFADAVSAVSTGSDLEPSSRPESSSVSRGQPRPLHFFP